VQQLVEWFLSSDTSTQLAIISLFVSLIVAPTIAIIAALLGAFIGPWSAHYLRRRGEVTCEAGGAFWEGGNANTRQFRMHFYNAKEIGIGILNFRVRFSKEGRVLFEIIPNFVDTRQPAYGLHLPSHERLSHLMIVILPLHPNAKQLASEADKIEVVMTVAGERERRENLPHWDAWQEPLL
jgi:hypothetical protein